jgi:hypothetical protein
MLFSCIWKSFSLFKWIIIHLNSEMQRMELHAQGRGEQTW